MTVYQKQAIACADADGNCEDLIFLREREGGEDVGVGSAEGTKGEEKKQGTWGKNFFPGSVYASARGVHRSQPLRDMYTTASRVTSWKLKLEKYRRSIYEANMNSARPDRFEARLNPEEVQ